MRTANQKTVFTTGQVARICHVAPRTVSKWFDSGKLRGYRIPGSRDRRIPLENLLAFMRAHGMPLDGIDEGVCRVLIVGADAPQEVADAMNASDHFDVRTAGNDFEAGLIAQQFRPHVMVLDVNGQNDEALSVCRNIKANPALQTAKVIAAGSHWPARRRKAILTRGFDEFLARPYGPADLARAVESVMNLAY